MSRETVERGLEDMMSREQKAYDIRGVVMFCPHCDERTYLMPSVLTTYEPRWRLTFTITCVNCHEDFCVDVERDDVTEVDCG